ncbi:hypothetical protein SELMODRAFT_167957 [Selaginella moellendorffii]|uniref:Glycosyltransferase n=1 Tax=Selaginella moellendorffii TaxID=88036 RepID=D8R4L5_SELML|nr:hypothetical protein SELMODRAFT_167957 [Selaginella moellendorffii]
MGSSTGAEGLAPHAAVLPIPTLGHITPFLHLSRTLASRGFVITFINTEGNHRDLKDVVSQEESFGYGGGIRFETVPGIQASEADFTAPETRQIFFEAVMAMQGPVESLLIRSMARDDDLVPPVSCFISDMLLPWSAEVARRTGIPEVKFWTASASCVLLDCSFPRMLEKGDVPVQETSDPDSVIDFIPGIDSLSIKDIPSSLLTSTPEGLERRSRIFSRNKEAACIFLNTVEELERKVVAAIQELLRPAKFLTIGPLLPSSFLSDHPADENTVSAEGVWKEDMHCLSWLDEREPRSVLYVSFGSMATLKANQIEKLALGLESSGQPFLWVMRPNLVSESEAPNFCEDFVVRTKSQGLVISWAPQLQVLKHPSVGGFLTHCGWNSTLEAVCSGVPLLCWPCFAEQHLNCKIIVDDWKVGLSFFRGSCHGVASKEVVHQVIRRLMVEDPGKEIRKRAIELRNEIRSTVTEGGSSDRNLSAFVDLISKRLV